MKIAPTLPLLKPIFRYGRPPNAKLGIDSAYLIERPTYFAVAMVCS